MTSNRPTIDDLTKFSVSDLYDWQGVLTEETSKAAKALGECREDYADFSAVLDYRFGDAAAAAFVRADKKYGKVRHDLDLGLDLVATVPHTVKWDQDKLKKIAADMTWEQVQHFFKIEFSVPESVFKAIPPDDPRLPALVDARTVKYGEPKLSLEKKDA